MKRTYCSKRDGSSSQQKNKESSLSFINDLVYWNYLYVQINYVYCLICITQSKKLKKLDKIDHNLSEKKCESLREMLQREELLGGSKGNVYQAFLQFLLKNEFLNINHLHILNN